MDVTHGVDGVSHRYAVTLDKRRIVYCKPYVREHARARTALGRRMHSGRSSFTAKTTVHEAHGIDETISSFQLDPACESVRNRMSVRERLTAWGALDRRLINAETPEEAERALRAGASPQAYYDVIAENLETPLPSRAIVRVLQRFDVPNRKMLVGTNALRRCARALRRILALDCSDDIRMDAATERMHECEAVRTRRDPEEEEVEETDVMSLLEDIVDDHVNVRRDPVDTRRHLDVLIQHAVEHAETFAVEKVSVLLAAGADPSALNEVRRRRDETCTTNSSHASIFAPPRRAHHATAQRDECVGPRGERRS